MNPNLEIILEKMNVPSVDDADGFIVLDRVNAIHKELNDKHLLFSSPHAFLFVEPDTSIDDINVIVSAHIDTVFSPEEHFTERVKDILIGNWDNAAGVAAAVYQAKLSRDPTIAYAFTGQEESMACSGVRQVAQFMDNRLYAAIALDVTNASKVSLENFANLPGLTGNLSRLHQIEHGWPDEGYIWQKFTPTVSSLCVPVAGDMHSPEGCYLKAQDMELFADSLADLTHLFSQHIAMEKSLLPDI